MENMPGNGEDQRARLRYPPFAGDLAETVHHYVRARIGVKTMIRFKIGQDLSVEVQIHMRGLLPVPVKGL
jgi:hypothetical protein